MARRRQPYASSRITRAQWGYTGSRQPSPPHRYGLTRIEQVHGPAARQSVQREVQAEGLGGGVDDDDHGFFRRLADEGQMLVIKGQRR